jgi:hypothetical protein
MYEPIGYPKKTVAAFAEGAALIAAVLLLFVPVRQSTPTVDDARGQAGNPAGVIMTHRRQRRLRAMTSSHSTRQRVDGTDRGEPGVWNTHAGFGERPEERIGANARHRASADSTSQS